MVWLIPVLFLFVPVLRLAPALYNWVEKSRVYRLYSELKRLENEMFLAAPGRASNDFVARLDRLEHQASRLSVPTAFKPLVYGLRLHIHMVRNEVQKSILP